MNETQALTYFENESFLLRLEGEILNAHLKENAILDKKTTEEAYRIYGQMGIGPGQRKVFEIMSGVSWSSITKDCIHLAKENGPDYFLAVAVVGNSIPLRLTINFFNMLYNSEIPFKMFSSEKKAKAWLEIYF